ncbi:transcription-repair coupling factor [Mailhella massiliensis]|uniref:Transcription-repair-coupling factor n=1 Tax=Mailhella massiliensis TaxID=1903261 RepID=A0A921AVK5_9BACT|nr:transcription-repair coupling factor [Mailhella massiliensis]HJD96644.1 transcription-repair coupling factor [Mailhella massiliensis]
MDKESLFHNMEEGAGLSVCRAGSATMARLAVEAVRAGRRAAIAVRSRDALAVMRGLTTLFTPELSVGRVASSSQSSDNAPSPLWERPWVFLPPFSVRSLSREGWAERMSVLYALRTGTPKGVVFTLDNMIPLLPPPDFLDARAMTVRIGEDIAPELLMQQLVEWGYQRVPMVAHAGDMARRGDILDVLPPGYEKPLRLEFFGDTVDEMRVFDFVSQRSVGGLEEATFLPVTPFGSGEVWKKDVRGYWKTLLRQKSISEASRLSLEHALEQEDMRLLPGCVYAAPTTLDDWFAPDMYCFLPGRHELREELDEAERRWREHFRVQSEETSLMQPAYLALRDADGAQKAFESRPRLYCEPLTMGTEQTGTDLLERTLHGFADLFPGQTEQDRPWQQLSAGLKSWVASHRQVVLAFASERGRRKFLKLAEQDGILPSLRYDPEGRGLYAVVAPYRQGAELVWDGALILGEELLQPRAETSRRVASGAFRGLDRYDDLRVGDLLVHRDYGVGRFGGLHRMSPGASGVDNDYLLLEYAEGARLYLPVDRLSVVQKFKADGPPPALDRLGGSSWTTSREKARKAVEKVAADLMQMYAWRKVAKGFSYSPVGEMYHEFEATFGFEETPDQARAIQEVFEDMDRPVPMDRLVCGDVGFGKTEVALRAAFRAACDGRQVALLCPTTVLAEQHYQTFRSRMAGFPVNVGLLSRFVPRARQTETLKAAAQGQIDILIGTHRLLSKDVELPNLGLLILDEEQRFGVRHKEKLKEMRRNVDALTLTATPIPRTLQLSMSGIRELSVLETAPAERKPVATALIDRDRGALKQVMERELARQGQVFFVHNRVQTLPRAAAMVRELVPEARVGMAHGQMAEKELEETMHKFWHGELDILVCTAIVESGLDFPRANTLIVDQAQMFGLGQLYQLRGRVGRSDRQAYAVFVVSDVEHLPALARERLRIILEMDYLGAGFQVAMEDLRLRGAGNILGEAQSGHMARVGLDLYLEMLEDAVARLKGEEELLRTETEINLGLPAHIPDSYIEDAHERLKYYKMLSSATDGAARENVEMEIRDRFGPFPEALETFLSVLVFKARVNELGVARADLWADRVRVTWAEGQKRVRPEDIVRLVMAHRDRIRLQPPATLELSLAEGDSPARRLDEALSLLEELNTEREGPAVRAGISGSPAGKSDPGHVASVKKTGYKQTS